MLQIALRSSAMALVLLLAGAAPATAAKRITGKLSAPGYTVIALDADGEAASQPTKSTGKFRLKPSAKRVSLHLRAADGTYAGPVVIAKAGKKGRKAILGLEAGSELGKVKVRAGYAKLKRDLPDEDVDFKRKARAKRGVPVGAGNFGRVASAATGTPGPGTDLDRDGIPGALDIDDDGDLVLDNLDQSSAGPDSQRRALAQPPSRGPQAPQGCGPNNAYCQPIASSLPSSFDQTVNVNAGSTVAEIDAALALLGALRFSFPVLGDSVELDCGGLPDPADPDGWIGGLTYCTRGGTGASGASPVGPGPSFPECCDTDGDGFGTIVPPNTPSGSFLGLGASSAQIKSGDLLVQRVTTGDTETQVPTTVNYVFVTVPALVSYSDTAGNSATVSYPVAPDGPGTINFGFPVSAPVGEDVVVTLTFWRPQRQAIPGSDPPTAEWMDIGHLTYAVGAAPGGGCPQASFSTTDPNLAPPALPLLGGGGLADRKDDEESSPGNTLTYTLNLSQCLAASGISSFFDEAGEELNLNFQAVAGATDFAHQSVWFERE